MMENYLTAAAFFSWKPKIIEKKMYFLVNLRNNKKQRIKEKNRSLILNRKPLTNNILEGATVNSDLMIFFK